MVLSYQLGSCCRRQICELPNVVISVFTVETVDVAKIEIEFYFGSQICYFEKVCKYVSTEIAKRSFSIFIFL